MRKLLPLLWLGLAFSSCTCKPPAPAAVDAGPPPAPPRPKDPIQVPDTEDGVHPNYALTGPVDPLAKRLCTALHEVPRQQEAACCKQKTPPTLTELCSMVVSSALRLGALQVDEAQLQACEQAQALPLDCASAGGWNRRPAAAACSLVLKGSLAEGKRCRSSLECAGEQRCVGSGPTDLGACAPARKKSGSCGTAVDALATYLPGDLDLTRPQCEGYCDHHRCKPAVPAGQACETALQCGPGSRCEKKVCVAGLVPAGQPCDGPCAAGLVCIDKVCSPPKKAGQACKTAFECQGGCIKGVCGMKCP
jgi:hypothetical protein